MPIRKPKNAVTRAPAIMQITNLKIGFGIAEVVKPERITPVKAPIDINPAWPSESSPEIPTQRFKASAQVT